MGQWSELPVNLLMDIEKHLGSNVVKDRLGLCIDKIRLRAVCVLWRFYLPKMPLYQQSQFTWLLQLLDNTKDASHGLFNPIEKKVYEVDLLEAQGRLFKGSSYGWLATVEDTSTSPTIYLLNPFTRSWIQLPPRNKFPDVINYRLDKVGKDYVLLLPDGKRLDFFNSACANTNFMHKIVLSSTPSRSDCVIVAIYGQCGALVYCKCKDKKWSALYYNKSYVNVIFHKGKLHALKWDGTLIVFENIGPNAKVTKIASPPHNACCHLYLVESSDGELIMVERRSLSTPKELGCERSHTHWIFKAYGFRVYKHDPGHSSWFLVNNLGQDMLFLGYNSSFSMSSSSRDYFSGYLGNCIYFTDSFVDFHCKGVRGGLDIGVYDLKTRRIKQLPGFKCDPKSISNAIMDWSKMGCHIGFMDNELKKCSPIQPSIMTMKMMWQKWE